MRAAQTTPRLVNIGRLFVGFVVLLGVLEFFFCIYLKFGMILGLKLIGFLISGMEASRL